ncbi:MAG: AAA family ATPase, partial [Natronomonas sp.]
MELTVEPVSDHDPGRGLAVVDRETLTDLGLDSGDFLVVTGPEDSRAVTQIIPDDDVERRTIRADERLRATADVSVGDAVTVEPADVSSADSVTVGLPAGFSTEEHIDLSLRDELISQAVVVGQVLPIDLRMRNGGGTIEQTVPIRITDATPGEAVVIRDWTRISVAPEPADDLHTDDLSAGPTSVSFADVGGLTRERSSVRETVELPLSNPELFGRLGIDTPNGVLLYGPPGTGKTLLIEALANETDIHVERVTGASLAAGHPSETEPQLRDRFEAAAANTPAVVFLDELDSIAADGEAGRSDGVGAIVSLLEEFGSDTRLVVVGTATDVEALDPALRRSGRFDREIEIGVPDRDGREEILKIHTRWMPLADDVDLAGLAERTHGFVGADIETLTREAALCTLRRNDVTPTDPEPDETALTSLSVTEADFESALRSVTPSALREVFVEVPDATWDDVGGLEDTTQQLQETIQWPLEHPDAFEQVSLQPAKGVLLYGP